MWLSKDFLALFNDKSRHLADVPLVQKTLPVKKRKKSLNYSLWLLVISYNHVLIQIL